MDIVTVLHDYGWAAAILFLVVDKLWPQFFGHFSRNKEKELDAKLDQMRLQQARDMEDAKIEREMRAADQKDRREINMRQVFAYEKMAEANAKANETTAQLLQQINNIGNSLNALTTFMVSYTSDMRANVAKMMEMLEASSDDIRSLDRAHGLKERGRAGTNPLTPPDGEAVKTSTPEKKE